MTFWQILLWVLAIAVGLILFLIIVSFLIIRFAPEGIYNKLTRFLLAILSSFNQSGNLDDGYFYNPPSTNKDSQEENKNLQVLLGISTPQSVRPKEEFTARFAAYLESFEREIEGRLKELSPRAHFYSKVKQCQWRLGTKVKVKCYGNLFEVSPPEDEFTWNGSFNLVDFDVIVSPKAKDEISVLKFDVLIDEFVIARLRVDVEISKKESDKKRNVNKSAPYSTAFASYSSEDRLRVLDRISEIERNGINVFLDCLSLHPGEEWKTRLEKEIIGREMFLLFWSANAKESEWVDWEWRTAYRHKGIAGIDPHPLDPAIDAKPPKELSSLHFDDRYNLIRKTFEKKTQN